MSREISFRLWDNDNNRFWYDVYPMGCENALTQEITDGECSFEYNNQYNTRCGVVEQCTGLKDMNGEYIYEGDIIKFDERYGGLRKVYFGEMEDSDCSGFYYLGWAYGEAGNNLNDMAGFCEIVGNIHQNPELLEGENE